jgi:FKBP-type peptidyl-prolyl cis-trans isomerase SlyD
MQISKDKVVTFHYRLKDESGQEMESSHGEDPVCYLHGHDNIISGIEKGLEGKEVNEAGQRFEIVVQPVDGYGERQEGATQRIPIKHLQGDKKALTNLKAGDVVAVNTDKGAMQAVVIKAGKFNVDVDTNHPLAGKILTFEIEVESVRDAAEEELAHGHAHGVGGHHH